ncbi:hypothetical protein Aph02nite_48740 [Actinoplanes philippinensis]|uniref:LPXTG-motif cell wall anchor domain-containing protein n=1 Tax=Actinoplanes philippinensis TaxID=35752 RepID=A0A1I2HW27_9ACTN|nr:LPXTG cell wall anchor domain-containing protein [Actinoplanes philippinensis]GIE78924.1 hypothetical protein Aph02nite_48740 [Actinoplanes philippinensis]SFF34179.1 LPXTG-motif cell wall anchor domain-containing protein [Actinoplanes philippinensis]
MNRPCARLLTAGVLASGLVALTAPPAHAAVILHLEEAPTAKTAAQQPASLRGCAKVPGGAVAGTAGWVFDQPAGGTARVAYVIWFATPAGEEAVIGVNPEGVQRLQPEGAPLPEGMAGALIDGGPGGLWLRAPEDWILIAGGLQIQADAAEAETFHLVNVCVPAPPPSASPSPSRSASASPSASTAASASPSASRSASPSATVSPSVTASPVPGGGGGLPITGPNTIWFAAAGLILVLAGVAAVVTTRRRGTTG